MGILWLKMGNCGDAVGIHTVGALWGTVAWGGSVGCCERCERVVLWGMVPPFPRTPDVTSQPPIPWDIGWT